MSLSYPPLAGIIVAIVAKVVLETSVEVGAVHTVPELVTFSVAAVAGVGAAIVWLVSPLPNTNYRISMEDPDDDR